MKKCNHCKKYKGLSEFSKDSETKDGFKLTCKKCCSNYYKQYYNKNSEKLKEKTRLYRVNNKEKTIESVKNWQRLNIEHIKEYNKQYKQQHKEELKNHYIATKEKHLKKKKEYRIKNKEKIKKYRESRKEQRKLYLKANKKRILKVANIYRKNKYKTDVNFRLAYNLRNKLYKTITRQTKTKSALELVGCSIKQLKQHPESQFKPGMSWDNYGFYGWHIDHIKSCCTFDLSKPEEQLKCFNYKNLRPLWAIENLSRSRT